MTLAHLGLQEDLVHWVQLDHEETLDLRVPLVLQDKWDLLDLLDHVVMLVQLVSQDPLVLLGLRVTQGMRAKKDLLELLEVQERLEVLGQMDQPVFLGLLDLVDQRDSLVLQVLVVTLDQWVRQGHQDQQVNQGHQVSRVQEEMLVFLAQLAPWVSQVHQVHLDH